MNQGEGEPVEIGKPPLDDTLVRTTANEVRVSAQKARRVEISLVVIAALVGVAIAGFTGWNTYRLRTVNQNLTSLLVSLEANSEAQHAYNEAHSESASQNFNALLENVRCFTNFFVAFNQAVAAGAPEPDTAALDACFKPPTPSPAPRPLPSETRDGKR